MERKLPKMMRWHEISKMMETECFDIEGQEYLNVDCLHCRDFIYREIDESIKHHKYAKARNILKELIETLRR